MLLSMLSISRSAYPFIIRAKASGMRLGLPQHLKQYDYERFELTDWMLSTEGMESGSSPLFLAQESMNGRGGYT